MNFSSPIPRAVQPKFHEGTSLASVRDSRNNSQIWKKGRATTNNSNASALAIQKINRQISRLERRMPGGIPTTEFFPFQIYNVQNATNILNSWRTFQISGGFVGTRSKYLYANLADTYFGNSDGNYEIPLFCFGTDGDDNASYGGTIQHNPNTGGDIPLDPTLPTLIFDGSTPSAGWVIGQILLDTTYYNTVSGFMAAFWIQIVDDPAIGVYSKLYGQMIDASSLPVSPFPSGQDIIPIGTVNFITSSGSITPPYVQQVGLIDQYQFGHLVNRYPCFPTSATLTTVDTPQFAAMRGKWTADALSGQVFYPGDVVIDDSVADDPVGVYDVYGVYMRYREPNVATVSPATAGEPTWKQISTLLVHQ